MKKFYLSTMLSLAGFVGFSQITATTYRGAFAPAPAAMWTDSWTNFDPQNTVYATPNVNVTANITADTHWTAGNVYYLKNQIYVKNNATLTIDPGVIIRGDHTAVGAGLFITKGAKLIAVGTADKPIVFTSDMAPGSRNKGDWGGVILLGKASFNLNNGVNNIEGIAPSIDTEYGGGTTPNDNDNSGTLKYVRIEFAGYIYQPNQEINGLTFGAVGRGTTIDYIQVSHSNDDSFEWFGGTVNCKHLVAFRGLDDDFDTDNGFSGNVQFGLGVRDPQVADNPVVSTSEGFESDNNANATDVDPHTAAVFSNFTMVGPTYRNTLPNNGGTLASGYEKIAHIRRDSQLKIYNTVFIDYLKGLYVDGASTETNALNNTMKFKNNIVAGITTADKILQVASNGNASATPPVPNTATITSGMNAAFNMVSWFNANSNTGYTNPITNAGILTKPYNLNDATIYTGMDYRPGTGSIALSGADFTDSSFAGIIQTTFYVDNDGDGYDSGTAVVNAATPPSGYSFTTNGSDCDDTNASIHTDCPVITNVPYRGAFAPAPVPMWTDNWTNFDPQNTVYPATNVDVTANITADTHWTAGNVYYLRNQIYVKNNATLTIDAGVIIRGDHTAVGAGLFITKGAKLIAVGTADKPIVFTSDMAPGSRNKGDWGGVILLGKASFNLNNGVNNIEGIAPSIDTEYGGGTTPNDDDNSGMLKYVRIEFAGYIYQPNQEINGLTFGAVGRGTTIDYIQVSHSNDDSFEWFGGTVNCKHLVAFRGLDDDFDTDNGFSGNVQFGLGVRDPQVADNPVVSTSEGFESDNNANATDVDPHTAAVFTNFTMVGPTYRNTLPNNGGALASGYEKIAHIRRASQLKIYNTVFIDYLKGLYVDGALTETNALNNTMIFKNNIVAGIATADKILQVASNGNSAATPVIPNTATITSGMNPAFNMVNWFNANKNIGYANPITNAGLLTRPYNTSDATIYTGLDYRPATGSIVATGADFSDAKLGLNDVVAPSSDIDLKAYPNPSATSFKLNYNSSSDEDIKVIAYDLTGRLIESRDVNSAEINNQEIGNSYNAGVYIIVLRQGGLVKTVRVIKN